MARRKIPSEKKNYKLHKRRLKKYTSAVNIVIDELSRSLCAKVDYNGDIADKDAVLKYVSQLIKGNKKDFARDYVSALNRTIKIASSMEWDISESNVDDLVNAITENKTIEPPKWIANSLKHNEDARDAFLLRRDANGNVVSKLQKQTEHYSTLIGESIASAIMKGTSAVSLASQVQKYLNDVDTLRGDYKEYVGDDGKAINVKYTAMRLARTEINTAYKLAEQERYQNLDFVVGYEVHRSGDLDEQIYGDSSRKHECDLCESLKGKYPKDFVFTNWHANCLCYITPILNTSDEFWSWNGRGVPPKSVNEVTEPPQGFKDYVANMENSIQPKSTPYFIKDNIAYVASLATDENKSSVSDLALLLGKK